MTNTSPNTISWEQLKPKDPLKEAMMAAEAAKEAAKQAEHQASELKRANINWKAMGEGLAHAEAQRGAIIDMIQKTNMRIATLEGLIASIKKEHAIALSGLLQGGSTVREPEENG